MTKKIYIKLLVVIQIMVLGVMLISCEKDEKKDETGILLKQGAFVDEKDNYKTFNENDEGVYKEISCRVNQWVGHHSAHQLVE